MEPGRQAAGDVGLQSDQGLGRGHGRDEAPFPDPPRGLARLVRFYAGGRRLGFANPVAGGYGFQFIDAETGATVGKGAITSGSIEGWDMAFPEAEDPVIVAIAEEALFWCRYSAVVGLTKGIVVEGGQRPR